MRNGGSSRSLPKRSSCSPGATDGTVGPRNAFATAGSAVVRSPLPLGVVRAPDGDTWVALSTEPLPVADAHDWAVVPDCGGVVLFTGTVRDHADGRPGVHRLEYEAYAEQVEPKLLQVAKGARDQWPDVRRIALLHRVGSLDVTDAAVVVVCSAPHRGEAFEAARWCIDTLKAAVPIWKKEHWEGGEDWGLAATDLSVLP